MDWFCLLLLASASCLAVEAAAAGTNPPPPSPAAPAALFPDKILARGKDFEIKQSQVDELYLAFKSNRAAQGQFTPEALRPTVEAEILERLIDTKLCLQRATPEDRAEGREVAETFIAKARKSVRSEEAFERQLLATGMTPAMFRAQIVEQAIVKVVLDREIRSKLQVPEAEARNFYETNRALFQQPERVRVRHILFSTRDDDGREIDPDAKLEKHRQAEKILARARAGEDFGKLIQEYSDDSAAKQNRGEYVIVRSALPQPGIPPEFEGAAFSLAPGQISDLVTTGYGYHIIQCLEKIPARQVDYASAAAQIRQRLLTREVEKRIPEFLDRLKKEARVQLLGRAE